METIYDFTISICTYNGENRLPQVLESLRKQKLASSCPFHWEIIVVDNNSSDKTPQIVAQYQEIWDNDSTLSYTFEPQQGLAFARQRGIEMAKSPLVGFLDDDNLPDENWLIEAYRFAQEHPNAGAYGSHIIGDLEGEPPPDFHKIAAFLAIIDRGATAYLYQRQQKILPPGAGLVVRRQAWLDHVPQTLFLGGRIGSSMLASEDLEALCYIQCGGWEIWHNPQMKIVHKIPENRLKREYLTSLTKGVGLARHHIRMLRLPAWQHPLATPIYITNDLRKLLIYFVSHHKELDTNLVTACELSFLWGSLLSPFYLLSSRTRLR